MVRRVKEFLKFTSLYPLGLSLIFYVLTYIFSKPGPRKTPGFPHPNVMPEKALAVKYRFSPKPNSSRNYCMAIGKSAACSCSSDNG
jgi:hypothetical protein